jgi:hypothetical protein
LQFCSIFPLEHDFHRENDWNLWLIEARINAQQNARITHLFAKFLPSSDGMDCYLWGLS